MTPTTGISNINLTNLNAFLTATKSSNNTTTNPFGIFGNQLSMPQSFDFSGFKFDFSNMNLNGSNFNFNFDFTNINSTTSAQYTARSGNNSAAAGATGLDQQFLARVKDIANKIGCDYKDLLGVMHCESGLKSTATNKNGGATGLIQFMPSTARSLGTTTDELRNMSALQQLDYVERFLMNAKNSGALKNKDRITAGDLYTLIFMPAKAGKEVIACAGSKEYNANKGLDTNKDGQITQTELGNRVISHHVNESIFA